MEQHTPKSNRISFSRKLKHFNENDDSTSKGSTNASLEKTPTQRRLSLGNDCSPVYIPHTQEVLEHLDVGWDWNSPEAKHKQKRPIQKRIHKRQSPKPIKRHTSNNEVDSYNKLKHELEALKNQLVESHCNEKHVGKLLFEDKEDEDHVKWNNVNDLFGDESLEEKMILQSQKIEELVTGEIKQNACDNINIQPLVSDNIRTSTSSKFELRKVKSDNNITNPLNQYGLHKEIHSPVTIGSSILCSSGVYSALVEDASFSCALQSYSDNKIIEEFQCIEPVHSRNLKSKCNRKSDSNKVYNLEEIELKRLKAVAKLQLKKQVASVAPTVCSKPKEKKESCQKNEKDEVSPIKCSPEEIEQKRLQALAKLEAKKKQEKIERNRKEALKRLEVNKKKRTIALQNLYKK